ncbi:S8 family serine peptidase [Streptomyces sp. NPDC008121]|uniref:S8 family serine peptidase n=1 Tax=Streptomyces sp. NPDC008121 TaxID=3364809 RepID=UPI0036EAB607
MHHRSAVPARKIFGTALAAGLAAAVLAIVPGTAGAVEGSVPGAGAPLPASGASQTGAAAPATDGPVERLIVGYTSGATEARSDDAAARDAEAKGKKAGESLGFERRLGTGAALVDLGAELGQKDAADVMAAFRADPDVAYAVPDRRVYATAAAPNDTYYDRQWDLFEAVAGMNVPGAWDKATGEGVKVAVIDTGYVAHSDLAANVITGYDFITDTRMSRDGDGRDNNAADNGDWMNRGDCGVDELGRPVPDSDRNNSWHGTHVAGTIAATTGNGRGVAGIAHDATVQPVRVLGWCGGTDADIIDAITWASGGPVQGVPANPHPADVINMSLGGAGVCNPGTQNAINGAVGRGTTVVVAAGNSNMNATGFQPANCDNVITVAASDREGNRAAYSNYGNIVDVTAPGGETALGSATGIWSTVNAGLRNTGNETYAAYQGTSMAAPHIAGLAALMNQASPSMTPAQIESAIKANARTLPGTCSGGCGAGLADAARTLGASGGTGSQPAGTVFTNAANVNIPDTNTPITSSLAVTGISGNAPTALKVAVDIKHTYRGDLRIELVAPNGGTTQLKTPSSGDSAADVITTFTVNGSGAAAGGTWKLRVTDVYSGDTGYIDSWSLTF